MDLCTLFDPRGNSKLEMYLKANSCWASTQAQMSVTCFTAGCDTQGVEPRLFIPGFLPILTSLYAAVYLQSLFLFHLDWKSDWKH